MVNNIKVSITDVITELNITDNKIEFMNDLNLFLNIVAFIESKENYYDIIREKFDEYMGKWKLNFNDSFLIISKYIKAHKLPYKILKDEGFKEIKSEKFILSMLVELYTMKLVIENNKNSKNEIKKFIYNELKEKDFNINQKDIILNDLDYLFKDDIVFFICRNNMLKRKNEIDFSLKKVLEALSIRKNIKLELNYNMDYKNNIENEFNEEIIALKKEIEKLKNDLETNNLLISDYIDKEIELNNEINKLQKYNMELVGDIKEEYSKALVDLVKFMNDSTNGNLLDRLYCYSKGKDEKNMMFIITNLLNVFRQLGIFPRETHKIGENVSIEEYSFYNYRFNKDISDIKLCEGEVIYPAWFYNNKEILKPYVNIKGD